MSDQRGPSSTIPPPLLLKYAIIPTDMTHWSRKNASRLIRTAVACGPAKSHVYFNSGVSLEQMIPKLQMLASEPEDMCAILILLTGSDPVVLDKIRRRIAARVPPLASPTHVWGLYQEPGVGTYEWLDDLRRFGQLIGPSDGLEGIPILETSDGLLYLTFTPTSISENDRDNIGLLRVAALVERQQALRKSRLPTLRAPPLPDPPEDP